MTGAANSQRPLVSVVIPTHGRGELLIQAVVSVLEQQHRPLEIVVVNDGGPAVPSAVLRMGSRGELQVVDSPTCEGPAAARHRGVCEAHGEIIAYLDDDDLFLPGHLRTVVEELGRDGAPPVVYTDARHFVMEERGGGWVSARQEPMPGFDFDLDRLLVSNYIPLICVGHRRDAYFEAGGFDADLPCLEDWELLIRLTRREGARRVPRVTAAYRHFEGIERVNTLRSDGLELVQRIYSAHPVGAALKKRRKRHLAEMAGAIRLHNRQRVERPVQPRLDGVSAALGKGKAREAEELLRGMIEELPGDGELMMMLAKIMKLTRRASEARMLKRRAEEADPFLFV